MDKITYIIKNEKIEQSLDHFDYSDQTIYNTTKINETTNNRWNVNVNGYMIKNNQSIITQEEYVDWRSAVDIFLTEHDENVIKGSNGYDNVRFEILSNDNRGAYLYKEYVNNEFIEEGWGFCKDFENEIEIDAWIKAVASYNNLIGKSTPTKQLKKESENIDKAIESLDKEIDEVPEELTEQVKIISNVLPEIETDPCQFISDVKEAAENSIYTISGLPSAKEIKNHKIKKEKNKRKKEIKKKYDSQKEIVKSGYDSLNFSVTETDKYFRELDAIYEEYYKDEANNIILFEAVIDPPYVYEPPTFIYENAEPPDGDLSQLPSPTPVLNSDNATKVKLAVRRYIKDKLALTGRKIESLRYNPDIYVDVCIQYNFDLTLLLAQAQEESHFGLDQRALDTNNIFSVGLYDNGQNRFTYQNMGDCIAPYVRLIIKDYLLDGKKTVDELLTNFVNKNGDRYASNTNYEKDLKIIRNGIFAKYPDIVGGSKYDGSDAVTEYKEVTFVNIYNPGAPWGASQTAKSHVAEAMRNLWVPLRRAWEDYAPRIGMDPTWIITSGYRPVGYKGWQKQTGSAHIVGYAIDVQPRHNGTGADKRDKVQKFAAFVKMFLQQNRNVQFDQILIEYSGGTISTTNSIWCHIGYKNQSNKQRRQYYAQFNANASAGKHGSYITL